MFSNILRSVAIFASSLTANINRICGCLKKQHKIKSSNLIFRKSLAAPFYIIKIWIYRLTSNFFNKDKNFIINLL